MADDADRAAETAELHARAVGAPVAAIRARLAGEGRADCAECGEEIPAARRAAYPGATRCVSCQAEYEGGR